MKLFESWACGVPFVSAEVGDRRAIIGQPAAGLLVRPGDPAALGQAILQVLQNPHLAASLRRRGLERIEPFYWDQLVRRLEQAYNE
jgi:glycosyltransferase involved in cell wall biosynthesis